MTMLPGYPPQSGPTAPGAQARRGKRPSGRAPASTENVSPAGAGGTRTNAYSKPRLTVRPALRWAALATLQAMGVRVTGETAPGVLAWEWSDNATLG